MRHALYCEVHRPTQNQHDPTQTGNMKRIPLPKRTEYDIQSFHKELHEAIGKGKKYVIDCMAKRLSQRGEFTDFFTKYPDDWEKLEELRGR